MSAIGGGKVNESARRRHFLSKKRESTRRYAGIGRDQALTQARARPRLSTAAMTRTVTPCRNPLVNPSPGARRVVVGETNSGARAPGDALAPALSAGSACPAETTATNATTMHEEFDAFVAGVRDPVEGRLTVWLAARGRRG